MPITITFSTWGQSISRARAAQSLRCGLPNVEFTVGLEREASPVWGTRNSPPHPGTIRLTVESEDHRIVIAEEQSLESWTWTYGLGEYDSFLYRRGEEKKISLGQGAVRYEPLGVKADGGWGTYFTPQTSTRYTLMLDVLEPQPAPQRPVRIILLSRGWK